MSDNQSLPGPRRLCLITGASAGIGAAFARVYARHGWDLALTARRADRLEALAAELRAGFGIETLVLPADLADPEAPGRLLTAIETAGRHVDALIDNAGYGLVGADADDPARRRAFLEVMVTAPTELSARLMPRMKARGFGRIVHVASMMGLLPGAPGHSFYSAAKAYLVKLSEAQHLRGRAAGVHVTALCPGLTRSEFHDREGLRRSVDAAPAWMWMSAKQVAEAGYAAVEANRPICVPGAQNRAIAFLARVLPQSWVLSMVGRHGRR